MTVLFQFEYTVSLTLPLSWIPLRVLVVQAGALSLQCRTAAEVLKGHAGTASRSWTHQASLLDILYVPTVAIIQTHVLLIVWKATHEQKQMQASLICCQTGKWENIFRETAGICLSQIITCHCANRCGGKTEQQRGKWTWIKISLAASICFFPSHTFLHLSSLCPPLPPFLTCYYTKPVTVLESFNHSAAA